MKQALITMLVVFLSGLAMLGVIFIIVATSSVHGHNITPETETTAVVETVAPTVEQIVEETVSVVEDPVDNVDNLIETEPAYTEEELEILAIIIYQEAGSSSCSDDTRRKVGSVFLNRVASPKFPDTFKAVATAKRQYGRLYWTGIKWPNRASNKNEAKAVERAYRIAEELLVNGSILPENVVYQAEFKQGSGVYCYQDGHYFCYIGDKK